MVSYRPRRRDNGMAGLTVRKEVPPAEPLSKESQKVYESRIGRKSQGPTQRHWENCVRAGLMRRLKRLRDRKPKAEDMLRTQTTFHQ